jgi:hypothetical protein
MRTGTTPYIDIRALRVHEKLSTNKIRAGIDSLWSLQHAVVTLLQTGLWFGPHVAADEEPVNVVCRACADTCN